MQTIDWHAPLDTMPSGRALDLAAPATALGALARRFDRFACGLAGHDQLLRFEPRRLSLRCTRCGHQTAGWTLPSSRPPRLLPAVD